MESSVFDRLTRLFANPTRRRSALAASAATGLAAITTGAVAAQSDDRVAEDKRGRRGPRGKPGPPGPPAGANIQVVSNLCDLDCGPEFDLICAVDCPPNHVASGGGFNVDNLGPAANQTEKVRISEPTLNADDLPDGWTVTVECFEAQIEPINVTVTAMCLLTT